MNNCCQCRAFPALFQISQDAVDPCSVLIVDGGGNNFECYDDGPAYVSLEAKGNAFGVIHTNAIPPSGSCTQTVADGFGNTFDCMPDGPYFDRLPASGSGLEQFEVGLSPFNWIYGEDFDRYPDGVLPNESPQGSWSGFGKQPGISFAVEWLVSGPLLVGETFEEYADGTFDDDTAGTPTDTVYPTGFFGLEAWQVGDGPP